MDATSVTSAQIAAASKRLKGFVRETPILSSPFLDEIAGRRVWLKAECLQHTGSFKYRGARNAIATLDADARKNGVLAYSSGNHAQGIARAASEFGAPAVIIMPADAPRTKIDNTRAMGAEIVFYDRHTQKREEIGARLTTERGLTLIPPYDHPQVIAGQATCGVELAAQIRALGIVSGDVCVCAGGGGLSAGIALALAEHAPGLRVRTVEPAGFDDQAISLRTGARVRNAAQSGSLCDAILTPTPGRLTFPILQQHAGPGLVVTDQEAMHALALAFMHLKIVVEPGGAVALAAALFNSDQFTGDDVIVVATGGNIDPPLFVKALEHLSK